MIKLKKNNMDVVLIYYYFNPSLTPIDAYKDMANPIMVSAATFRKWDKTAKIQILDCSDTDHNWGDWPNYLNIEVYRNQDYKVPKIYPKDGNQFCIGMLGKIPALFKHVSKNIKHHSTIVVADSDIFFLRDPLPLAIDHSNGLCCSPQNTGYFYFTNPWDEGEMNEAHKILELWAGLCAGAMVDPFFNEKIRDRCKTTYIQEEVVFFYLQKMFPNLLIKDIPYTENFWFDWPTRAYDLEKIKNLHYRVWRSQAAITRKERGRLALCITELKNHLLDVLDDHRLRDLYEGWIWEYPFSIYDHRAVNKFLGNW